MIRPVIKHTYTGYDTWDLVNLTANFPDKASARRRLAPMGYRHEPTNVAELAGGGGACDASACTMRERRLGLDSRKPQNLNRTCFFDGARSFRILAAALQARLFEAQSLKSKPL